MKLYNDEVFEEFMDDPKCADCGQLATQRCSKCRQAWYCSRDCQLRQWKGHKSICALFNLSKEEEKKKSESVKEHQKKKATEFKKPLI